MLTEPVVPPNFIFQFGIRLVNRGIFQEANLCNWQEIALQSNCQIALHIRVIATIDSIIL
jgi:hypothetical protein